MKIGKKDTEVLKNAISHLKGYALLIESRTQFKPIALNETIKNLEGFIKWKK